jgi:hypothetical protein
MLILVITIIYYPFRVAYFYCSVVHVDPGNAGEERAFSSEEVFCRSRKGEGLYKGKEQEW